MKKAFVFIIDRSCAANWNIRLQLFILLMANTNYQEANKEKKYIRINFYLRLAHCDVIFFLIIKFSFLVFFSAT